MSKPRKKKLRKSRVHPDMLMDMWRTERTAVATSHVLRACADVTDLRVVWAALGAAREICASSGCMKQEDLTRWDAIIAEIVDRAKDAVDRAKVSL